jgi:hypothetical protein
MLNSPEPPVPCGEQIASSIALHQRASDQLSKIWSAEFRRRTRLCRVADV